MIRLSFQKQGPRRYLPAGPVKIPRNRYINLSDHFSSRFEDHRDPTGIGRQLDPTYSQNRRVFKNYSSKIILPKSDLENKLKERKENKLAATSIQTMKNDFDSVNRSRFIRPFSNKGLHYMHSAQEGRHLSIVSMSFPTRATINREHMASRIFTTYSNEDGSVKKTSTKNDHRVPCFPF